LPFHSCGAGQITTRSASTIDPPGATNSTKNKEPNEEAAKAHEEKSALAEESDPAPPARRQQEGKARRTIRRKHHLSPARKSRPMMDEGEVFEPAASTPAAASSSAAGASTTTADNGGGTKRPTTKENNKDHHQQDDEEEDDNDSARNDEAEQQDYTRQCSHPPHSKKKLQPNNESSNTQDDGGHVLIVQQLEDADNAASDALLAITTSTRLRQYPRVMKIVEQIDAMTGQVVKTHRSMRAAGIALGIPRLKIAEIVEGKRLSYKRWTFRCVAADSMPTIETQSLVSSHPRRARSTGAAASFGGNAHVDRREKSDYAPPPRVIIDVAPPPPANHDLDGNDTAAVVAPDDFETALQRLTTECSTRHKEEVAQLRHQLQQAETSLTQANDENRTIMGQALLEQRELFQQQTTDMRKKIRDLQATIDTQRHELAQSKETCV
jgi:hypothetical protein